MPVESARPLRCAIYTRKSTEHGLEQEFNSLDAQREACEAYIKSQASQGWRLLPQQYNDPAYSGGNLDRPALKKLLADITAGKVDVVVVYKIDRLTRSLADFAKLVETFDSRSISFVAVTQQFNTTTSMGRLTLNVLLSFAQFERELASERVRDKVAASRKKGKWTGGTVPLGYEAKDKKLVINKNEAQTVRTIFQLYLELDRSAGWSPNWTEDALSPSDATPRSPNTRAAFPSPTVPSPISLKIASTSAKPTMAANGSRESTQQSSIEPPLIRSRICSKRTTSGAVRNSRRAALCSKASFSTTRATGWGRLFRARTASAIASISAPLCAVENTKRAQ